MPHHHGEAETGAYVLSGRARIYFGENYQEFVDLSEGDFMFVPPFLPDLEANMSTTDELWWIACRSPENIIVNLVDVSDASLVGYRRAWQTGSGDDLTAQPAGDGDKVGRLEFVRLSTAQTSAGALRWLVVQSF